MRRTRNRKARHAPWMKFRQLEVGMEWKGIMQCGQVLEDIGQEWDGGAHRNAFLPFGSGQSMANLDRENSRGEEIMQSVLIIGAQLQRFIRVRLQNLPLKGYGSVDDIFHDS